MYFIHILFKLLITRWKSVSTFIQHWSMCMHACMLSQLQSCPSLCDPMDCSLPGFSVRGILQARVLEWVAMPSFRESSRLKDQSHILAGGFFTTQIRSDQISRSVVSDSLRPHELQHARPPCPSPTPGVHSDSRPSSQWCHPAISFSFVPFSSCPQSLPASESFPMSQLFAWGAQSIGVSAYDQSFQWTPRTDLL